MNTCRRFLINLCRSLTSILVFAVFCGCSCMAKELNVQQYNNENENINTH